MRHHSSLASGLLSLTGAAALAVTALGCGSSTKATTSTVPSRSAAPAAPGTSATTAAAPTSAASTAGALSGTWSGHYSGSFSGTFNLTWAQSGSDLNGTIMISGFNNRPTSINGTVQGHSVRFGTVGSEAISYSGSFSGNSMSGSWQIQAGGKTAGTGSWSAAKSS
jgi:hypothetical protein